MILITTHNEGDALDSKARRSGGPEDFPDGDEFQEGEHLRGDPWAKNPDCLFDRTFGDILRKYAGLSEEALRRKVQVRRDRCKKLWELKAPQVIYDIEMTLLVAARTELTRRGHEDI